METFILIITGILLFYFILIIVFTAKIKSGKMPILKKTLYWAIWIIQIFAAIIAIRLMLLLRALVK